MYRSVVESGADFLPVSSLKGRICSLKTSREGLVSPCVLTGLRAGTRLTGQGC